MQYILFKGMQPNTMELECKNNVRGVKICSSMTEKEYEAVFVMSTGQLRTEEPTTSSSRPVSVTLSAPNIPGADLSERLASHSVPALRW